MAYTGTLCTEAEINMYAGELVDATGNTEANHNSSVGHAEANICLVGKYDFVTNFSSLNSITKKILAEYCARSSAISMIAYNTAGYASLIEAEDMITIHIYKIQEIEKLITDINYRKYLINGF